ncbi:MAG: NAD(P)/FAD-dependent oxidoreductase [Flavobacteriales bacterium]|nr:NAD(P)/FAD-dependent oxidoreductase [Flavobacteriales bacterium]MBP6697083.1 NAD(P)/FAD-dependent oxidoreductase [Flavobacteriales bacterium]
MSADRDFDVVVIGAGLGGLQCAFILASEGKKVVVLEQNSQLGGSLQVFSRNKRLFDTGVHYLGGLAPGQNLHRYFSYFGIMDKLKLHRMDPDGFDRISFDGDPTDYPIAQGYENFVRQLLRHFPKEEQSLQRYVADIRSSCERFPLYYLRYAEHSEWEDPALQVNARDHIASLTKDVKLRAVLGASNVLHGGRGDRTPFYMHALVLNTYIESAWRCVDGGSQIAKHLAHQARAQGATILNRKRVIGLETDAKGVRAVRTSDGDRFACRQVVADIHPVPLLAMLDAHRVRPAYRKRVEAMGNTIGSFTVQVALEPGLFPYLDHNHYHFRDHDVWAPMNEEGGGGEGHFLLFTPLTGQGGQHVDSASIMTFMPYSEVAQWGGSHNTVAEPGARNADYEAFKQRKSEQVLRAAGRRFPQLLKAIRGTWTTTPLTFRDYIGCPDGTTYGIQKEAMDPIRTFLSPRTKVPNLLLTGQNINLHGILGVTVSSVVTCAELVGKRYLVKKIQRATGGGEVTVKG